jgi:hypothetical protein
MYTGCRTPEFQKKKIGRENVRWKTNGEATQVVDRRCAPGCERSWMTEDGGGKLRIGRVGSV